MKKLLPLLSLLLLLAGCPAGETPTGASDAPRPPPSEGVAEPAPPAPTPATKAPDALLTQDGVFYGCKTDADCEVKNIGNCCGYYPACVNRDSPTFPDKVKADCAAQGTSSICGFPEIAGCECIEGRCSNRTGPMSGAELQ
jgi:hypothetical protein